MKPVESSCSLASRDLLLGQKQQKGSFYFWWGGGLWFGFLCGFFSFFFFSCVPLTQGRRNVRNLALPLLVTHQLSAKKYQE